MDNFKEKLITMVLNYSARMLSAVFILIIGTFLIKIIINVFEKAISKTNLEKSLHSFFKSLISVSLKILLVITIASTLGVKMTSFIALLGSAGLAIGLALQGSLSNFAGGVLILLFKPFRVNDFIETDGITGKVKGIQILYTILLTPDNKQIFIPNGKLANNSIINYSVQATRRVDVSFGVSYDSDIKKVKGVVEEIIEKNEKILKDPKSFVGLLNHGDSSLDFVLKVWVNTSDYWDVFYYFQEELKESFDKNGIEIPYPQMDVFIKSK